MYSVLGGGKNRRGGGEEKRRNFKGVAFIFWDVVFKLLTWVFRMGMNEQLKQEERRMANKLSKFINDTNKTKQHNYAIQM